MRAPLALIVLGLAAGSANAGALPPPPYAADPQYQTPPGQPPLRQDVRQDVRPDAYRQPQAYDRYSGGAAHPVAAPTPQQYAFGPSPAAAAPVRTLGWSGKAEAASQQASVQPQGGWSQMSARWSAPAPQPAAQAAAYPAAYPAAAQQPAQGWRPLYPSTAPAAAQSAPRTIYDAPTAAQGASTPQRQASLQPGPAAQSPGGPRFYSLHREYGIEPDPIPIPPKFFGPTADLSAPPPDPVLKRVTDANGQTHTQAVPSDDQGG